MPNRIQQEVDELLAKLEASRPKRPFWSKVGDAIRSAGRSAADSIRGIAWPRLSAGHLLLLAVAVVVVAYLWDPTASGAVRWIIAGGIVAFVLAFVFSLRRQSRPPQKYWRDKPMDLRTPGPGTKLRSWWDRRNRR